METKMENTLCTIVIEDGKKRVPVYEYLGLRCSSCGTKNKLEKYHISIALHN